LISFFKKLVPYKLKKKLMDQLGVPSQELSLKKIRALGFNPRRCFDIGAYEGNWAIDFKAIFPGCSVFMIEGQEEKRKKLDHIIKTNSGLDYRIALLGATSSVVEFHKYETASSVLSEHNTTNAIVEKRNLVKLDEIAEELNFYPDFIKIDTQGYELEILKGGGKVLASAEFVLLEVSFLDIYINCPLAHEALSFMHARGFVIYDICTLMRRPLEQALFQSDFLFVKENSQFRADKRWI